MGCFAAPKARLSSSLRGTREAKQAPIPTSELKTSTPSFRARALRGASRLVRNQHRALSAPSDAYSSFCSARDESLLRLADGCSVAFSAPIPLESGVSHNEVEGSSNLFPLPPPPPPPDDASSQSVSSIGSGCSTSSARFFSSAGSGSSSVVHSSKGALISGSAAVGVIGMTTASCTAPENLATELRLFNRPLPLPPPPESCAVLRVFSVEEIAGACQNFAPEFWIREGGAGPVFRAIVKSVSDGEHTLEVAVTRVTRSRSLSLRKWTAEVNTLSRLSHPNLCKVVGFSAEDPSLQVDRSANAWRERLLVYESTRNGNLEGLLYGRVEKAPLDWATRSKIALGAAQGLAFLHERSPRQILYRSFKTINIQVDKEFNAKLCDYGFAWCPRQLAIGSPMRNAVGDPYTAPETRLCDELSAKSNVWSFGIVLLELMTGRQNMDEMFPSEERSLAQWARPSLIDVKRLYLIMDPELKGRYATRSAKRWADIALRCLSEDPVLRPSMREVVFELSGAAAINRDTFSEINMLKVRHCNLGNAIESPARSIMFRASPYESRRPRFLGFLSGEITKEPSKASVVRGCDSGPQSQYGFFSGEILQVPPSLLGPGYHPPPLGRSVSSGVAAASG